MPTPLTIKTSCISPALRTVIRTHLEPMIPAIIAELRRDPPAFLAKLPPEKRTSEILADEAFLTDVGIASLLLGLCEYLSFPELMVTMKTVEDLILPQALIAEISRKATRAGEEGEAEKAQQKALDVLLAPASKLVH